MTNTDYSNFKLRDCINKVEPLIDYAIELGHKAIAITEHETISSSVLALDYYKKVKEKHPDFKVILGNEIYLTRNGLTQQNFKKKEDRYYHFVLLAKDAEGHKQIRELSTRAWLRSWTSYGMIRTPTYYQDLWDIIGENPGHVVGTTACLGGAVGTQLMRYREEKEPQELWNKIVAWINHINKIFGQGNFYLEMQPSHTPEQIYVNNKIIELSAQTNVPYLISTDSHYLKKEDRLVHKAFLTSQQGEREVDSFYASTYMMNTEEIYSYMEKHIGEEVIQTAFQNSQNIIDMCEDYELKQGLRIPYLPKHPIEPTEEMIKRWEERIPMARNFFESSYESDRHLIAEIITRIEKDPQYMNEATWNEIQSNLSSIKESSEAMGVPWSAYLLNVKDYVDLIWEAGSLVGVGRGSAGGFILLNILGITQMNPLRETTKTYSWRFLNPERVSPLDIDIDTSASKREQVYQSLQYAYGVDRVAKILTLTTEKARSAILTAARGVGVDVDTASYIASFVTAERGIPRTLSQIYYGDEEEGIKPNQQFKKLMDEDYPEIWAVAPNIEGLINGYSVHAGGVIFVDEPFTERTALMKAKSGDIITQFDLHTAEDTGLIKIDLLSTRALDRIQTSLELLADYGYIEWENSLKETYEKVLGVYNLERNAPEMWKMVWNHEIQALFQMEQQSGLRGVQLTQPKSVDELATLNSVIRLMPSEKGSEAPLEKFARFKENPKLWYEEMSEHGLTEEEMELLEPHLGLSYGILEAQEKMMSIVQLPEIGGHSLTWADALRKAVAKKAPEEFERLEKEYYDTIKEKNLSFSLGQYVWEILIKPSRGYSFNSLLWRVQAQPLY